MPVSHLIQINCRDTHLPKGFGSHGNALTEMRGDCPGYGAAANEAENTEGRSALRGAGELGFPRRGEQRQTLVFLIDGIELSCTSTQRAN